MLCMYVSAPCRQQCCRLSLIPTGPCNSKPGDLYRLLPADEKDRLTSNFTAATADVPEPIRIRAIARFYQADEHCGKEMARKTQTDLKKILEEVKRQQALESR